MHPRIDQGQYYVKSCRMVLSFLFSLHQKQYLNPNVIIPKLKEGLAIVFAVRMFHQYVYGSHFTIQTDNKPLCEKTSKNKHDSKPVKPN